MDGTYATGDHIQALRILRREIFVPEHLAPYVFFGLPIPNAQRHLLDLSGRVVTRCIIEVCRVHSYVKDGWILMNHKNRFVEHLPMLPEVATQVEDVDRIRSNLDVLSSMINGCPMLLMVPPTFLAIPDRYQLAFAISSWCKDRGQTFFDPSLLAAQYGRERCFLENGADHFHFSDFMIDKVAAHIQDWIASP